jgi:glycerol-3-phosphate acyltransferase PlsX
LTAIGSLPVVVDAMGGDRAPTEIVAGARQAVDELGIDVVLMGPPELVGDTLGLPLLACTEVIGMDEDPAKGVRRKKDSSLVRSAELVRDGEACAMVSAGNTGATMGAALLRMGRLKGVHRPCIATPLPKPGRAPAVLVDAGANSECTPAMLLQFAQMASAFASARFDIAEPTVGLLSIGEESSKGTPLVKETHALLADAAAGVSFFGNVEGRDLLDAPVDVVVTDGFTGNVALKTLEGSLRFIMERVVDVFGTDEETQAAAGVLLPHLAPLITELDPETFGGAMLLGLDGVCIISHGSSSALAMKNAIKVGHDLAVAGITEALSTSISAS